ncbi:MAG: hypothetical protein ACJ8ER_05835 [Allosphingosinicella sp.]
MNLRLLLPAALAAFIAAQPAPAAAQRSDTVNRPVCVPLRDRDKRPTGHEVCRSARQWERILARQLGRPLGEIVQPFRLATPRG